MRPLHKALVGAAAAMALVGVTGLAAAAIKNIHVVDVRLPDGAVAHIRYVGDMPPTVSFAAAPMTFPILSPLADPFAASSPFAALERVSEDMDRQSEELMRELGSPLAMALGAPGLTQIDMGKLPPGAQGFSMVSTLSGRGVCTRSVQYRSGGGGKPPQVEIHTSGACPGAAAPGARYTQSGTAGNAQGEHPRRQAI